MDNATDNKPTDFTDFVRKSIDPGVWAGKSVSEEVGPMRSSEIETR
jgi:hypothetical protein